MSQNTKFWLLLCFAFCSNHGLTSGRQVNDAGVYVQLSQAGIDYITGIAQRVIPDLIANYTIPNAESDGYELKDFVIESFVPPNISATFAPDEGIEATITLPHAQITGAFSGGFAFFSSTGKMRARVEDLVLRMVVTFTYNETVKKADVRMPVCDGQTGDVLIVFGGGFSTVLNAVRHFLAEYLTQQLDEILCQLTMMATKMLSEEIAHQQRTFEENEIPGIIGGTMLHLARQLHTPTLWADYSFVFMGCVVDLKAPPKITSNMLCGAAEFTTSNRGNKKWRRKFSDFGINFDILGDPSFTETHAMVPFHGGITYRGLVPLRVHRPTVHNFPWGQRMATFVVSEYTPNTFFNHVYAQRLGQVYAALRVRDLPKLLRKAIEYFCFGCELRMVAGLTDAPVVTVTPDNGVSLYIQGKVRLIFDGPFKQFDIVTASTGLTITVKPYVEHGTVYGKIDLDTVDVSVEELGVSGLVGDTVGKAMRFLVPRKLWPQIRRKLKFALDRKGMKLPVVCGLELKHTQLRYVDHALVIDTDLEYDAAAFLKKFAKTEGKKK